MAKEWHLAIQEHNATTGYNQLNNVRLLSADELDKIHAATAILRENLEDAPYQRLKEEYDAFKAKVKEITDSFDTRSSSGQDLKSLSKLLDNFLSALRAFDDRTSHSLSLRYGKPSKQFDAFKTSLSYEFDNVFAYRFACQLRNYSQHTGTAISSINAGGSLGGKSYCNPTFDPESLLSKYTKWQAQVKKDLKSMSGSISVETVLDNVMQSCTKAYYKLMLSLAPDIKPAMDILDKYIREAQAKRSSPSKDVQAYPILLEMDKAAGGNYNLKHITIQPIRSDYMSAAVDVYRQAIVVV